MSKNTPKAQKAPATLVKVDYSQPVIKAASNDNQVIEQKLQGAAAKLKSIRGEMISIFCSIENELSRLLFNISKDKNYSAHVKKMQSQLKPLVDKLEEVSTIAGAYQNKLKSISSLLAQISTLIELRNLMAHSEAEILFNNKGEVVFAFELIKFDCETPHIMHRNICEKELNAGKANLCRILGDLKQKLH